jgi:L-rhamnose 1-dehydrogenase
MRLQDKVCIITGAAQGIGRAIAERFGHEGARVAIVDIREAEGLKAEDAVRAAGGEAVFIRTDVSDRSQVLAMVEQVLALWGKIDILVNDAGVCPFADFLDMPEVLWDQVLDVNLKGYFLVSQAVARTMVARGVKGRIIAVSSISAEFGGSQQAHYCASKAGINLLMKSMAISLGPHGITCNAVLPGTVETDINRHVLSEPTARAYWSQRAPLGRIGQPEDIAGPVLFFATDDAAWCTGALLVVDGGVSVNLQ